MLRRRPARPLACLVPLLAVGAVARAQSFDGHGPVPPPQPGTAGLPVTVLAPTGAERGDAAVGALLELVDRPVVTWALDDAGEPVATEALGSAFAVDLSGRWSLTDRVHLGLTAPIFLGSAGTVADGGLALGDLHLWVPISLVRPRDDARGVGLDLVPWVDLPTGAEQRLLGDQGTRVGLTPTLGVGAGPIQASAHLGVAAGGRQTVALQEIGGVQVVGGGSLGARFAQTGLGLEVRSTASFDTAPALDAGLQVDPGDVSAPTELFLAGSSGLPGDTWVRWGVGRGVTAGIGSANLRIYLGAGVALGRSEDGAVVEKGPRIVRFEVTDPAGAPLAGAEVLEGDDVLGTTDAEGVLEVDQVRWRRGVTVRADGRATVSLEEPDGPLEPVALFPVPAPVPLVVTTQDGSPVAATARAVPVDVPGVDGPVDGPVAGLRLPPGTWDVAVVAAGFGPQARRVVVPVGGGGAVTEVVLTVPDGDAAVAPQVVGPDGRPVVGARVLLDGLPVGTTGADGQVSVAGLAVGDHRLEVSAVGFTPVIREGLSVVGETQLRVGLSRLPGSVKVVVRDGDGAPVRDAVVRFLGPSRLAPMPLGATGERVQVLGEGRWSLLVSSPTSGVQQRDVVIPEDARDLITVAVVLQPEEDGAAELRVVVVDPDGVPVDGAEVLLDDEPVGATSTGGAVTLAGLRPGLRDLEVTAAWFDAAPREQVLVVDGPNEQVVPLVWQPGVTRVSVRGPEGAVPDATLRFAGPTELPPVDVGPSGRTTFQLPGGEWSLTLASPTAGLATARVAVEPDVRRLHAVDARMGDVGGLAELALGVADPDGRPVDGAEVRVDDVVVGTTTNVGALEVRGLAVGQRRLDVWAPLLQPASLPVRLMEDRQEVDVDLDWAAGAVRFRVEGPDGAVTDALLRIHGPGRVPPARVDALGERVLVLGAGRWQVLASSPTMGLAQAALDVIPEAGTLQERVIPLAPADPALASLWVRLESQLGVPVPGARVSLGGEEVGVTGEGGALLLDNLPPGPQELTLVADGYQPHPPVTVELVGGEARERLLRLAALPGQVDVTVVAPDGAPAGADLSLSGPADHPGTFLDPGETATLDLPPGTWELVAASEEHGPGRATVEVAPAGSAAVELRLTARVAVLEADAVVLEEQIQFEFDKAELGKAADPMLDAVAALLLTRSDIIRLEVAGHTDNVGDLAYNRDLSQRRAEAVLAALVARGVAPEVLSAVGYGAQKPIGSNDDDGGRAANRRVEFTVVEGS